MQSVGGLQSLLLLISMIYYNYVIFFTIDQAKSSKASIEIIFAIYCILMFFLHLNKWKLKLIFNFLVQIFL